MSPRKFRLDSLRPSDILQTSYTVWVYLRLLLSLRCAEEVLQLLEGFLASRYENEIVSTLCETVRIASPDAPRRACHQGGAF